MLRRNFTSVLKAGGAADDADKIAQTLYKYLARMCTRSTPYGLLAGCATATPADRTEVRFDPERKHLKFAWLDMEFLAELVESVLASEAMVPYMHDGSINTLQAVVDFYNNPDKLVKNPRNRHKSLTPLNLSKQKMSDLLTFLNSLTDDSFAHRKPPVAAGTKTAAR